MVYDVTAGATVLFGGVDGSGNALEDTWTFDGATWTRITPSGAPPGERSHHAMVYDAATERVLLVGGRVGSTRFGDAWSWDGAAWTPLSLTNPPPARASHALTHDPHRDRVVLSGGTEGGPGGITYELSDSEWTAFDLETTPGATGPWLAAAYDAARETTVGAGGGAPTPGRTWSWDGSTWRVEHSGAVPSTREKHALAYDARRERVVLFGGFHIATYFDDTWEWDGLGWTEIAPSGARPLARKGHRLVYDAARDAVVLFGGIDAGGGLHDDLWTWDGGAWTEPSLLGARPPARAYFGLAYDTARGRTVLFGGLGANGQQSDVWEWDGSAWSEASPSGPGPVARSDHAMAYDAHRERVMVHGGLAGASMADLWEWDGTAWVELDPPPPVPGASERHALVYDERRRRMVLWGRSGAVDHWELAPPDAAAVRLGAALPPDLSRDQLTDVRVRAFCGGAFSPFGSTDRGARLRAWVRRGCTGGWETLGRNGVGLGAGTDTRRLIDFQPSTEPAQTAQRLVGPARRVYLECRPDGGSGSGQGEVELDYLEVRLEYATE
jgi:hypothetical protein